MPKEVDAKWHYDPEYGAHIKWCWCNDQEDVRPACEACALCNADNVEMQMEGYDQVLLTRFPSNEVHLIEWRWSRGER